MVIMKLVNCVQHDIFSIINRDCKIRWIACRTEVSITMQCPALYSLNASKCRQTIRRLRNELACCDSDVIAIRSLAMYISAGH